MRKALTAGLALVLALGLASTSALAYDFPSTNEKNKNQEVPGREGQDAPYVEFIEARVGEVDLEFVNNTNSLAFFEYREDGQKVGTTSHPVVTDDVIHPGVSVDGRDEDYPVTVIKTFKVDQKVEIRLALGGERDWDFDWTAFAAAPAPPESLGAIQRNARASEVHNIRISGEYWVVEHEVDAKEVEQIWWYENNEFHDVTQPQEDRPEVSDLWINERDAGNITIFYLMNDDEWLYLAPRFNGRGDLVQVNGFRP